jgi:hypothetical protein
MVLADATHNIVGARDLALMKRQPAGEDLRRTTKAR